MKGTRGSDHQTCHRRRRRRRRIAMSWTLHWLVLGPVLLAAVLPVTSAYSFDSEQRFAMEPQDQTAVEGTKVTLPCRVINKSGTLQWTKDDFGLGTHRNLSGFERYTMVGSDEEGDFSLEINPVILDDDARYQCQVGPGPQGQPGVRSRFARLTVLVAPEPPRIIQGSTLQTTEDREIELECVSAGGKPAAEITWIDGEGTVLTEGIEYSKEPLSDSRRYTARSVLKLTPKKRHHNTTFVCQAQNTADRMARSAGLRLEVKYAPKVTVSVVEKDPSGRIPEGSDVRLFCHADANPSDLTYKWFLDDVPIQPNATTELILYNVSRSLHDAIVKCQVHNAVGKSEESETLDITYGPQFRQRPSSVYADPGSTVTMTCDVDGNPTPEVQWLLIHEDVNRDDRFLGILPNLTFVADHDRKGRYYCKARVEGFPEIGAEAEVFLNGKPEIVSKRMQFIHSGEARVECEAISVPKHERITWTHNGREITKYDADYNIVEDLLTTGIKSILFIRDTQDSIDGIYNCTVTNAYGTDTIAIQLIARKTFPMLIIMTGVIGGVIVIIALTMVVVLCQRKVKKPPACTPPVGDSHEAEKQCRESDRSSNISDMKLELRTGSSVSRPGSETGSERGGGGVPLAGPVHLPLSTLNGLNGGHMYRYPNDYSDATFPPKSMSQKDGQNNNGYVPYVDYARDYTPPLSMLQIGNIGPLGNIGPVGNNISTLDGGIGLPTSRCPSTATSPLSAVDPRYSAAYGNPYLRSSSVSLLPPHTSPAPSASPSTASTGPLSTAIPAGLPNGPPPPPPYSAVRNGAAPQVARLPNSPTSQYIVPSSQMATIKRGTLATHV